MNQESIEYNNDYFEEKKIHSKMKLWKEKDIWLGFLISESSRKVLD